MLVLINNPANRHHGRLGIAKPFFNYFEITFVCRKFIPGYYLDADGTFIDGKSMIILSTDIKNK